MIYRQGDVLIERVNEIQGGKLVPRESGRVILAHGEVTGHAHAIADPDVELREAEDGTLYLRVIGEATLSHEEHGAIAIPAGTYRVTRQREYSPEAIRNVAD